MWQPCELLYTCYLLTYLQQSDEQVCVEPRTSALNMTLPAAAARAPADINPYLAAAAPAQRQSCCCTLAQAADVDRKAAAIDGTDRRTDGQTLDRYVDSAWYTTRACSVNNCEVCLIQTLDRRLAHVPYSQRSHSFVWSWRPLNYRLPSNLLNVV